MSENASVVTLIAGGVVAGVLLMSWASKPAPVAFAMPAPVAAAAPAPVAAIDYAAITAAVKAGFAAAPAAKSAPAAAAAPAAPVRAKRRHKAVATAVVRPAVVYYVTVPRCTCAL